ncbi:MAG TPA: DNA-directed RNA polymerase subunit omega, partial [Terracidiphilus sp.]|nr:DNA-directed RNA polymerase subunit omega [Terracidiphilus sp.]
ESTELPASSNFPLEMTPMTIETSFDSNYRKVLVAARRARQLQNGSQALVPTHSNKACRIAQEEIEAGKIAYVKNEVEVTKPLVEGPAVPILLS